MGKGIVKLGDSKWATKDGNLLAYKETNNRFTNTEFTFARGTDATYVGEDGLIANETGDDTPRIDFLDDTDGHLLLEPASTNLITYSNSNSLNFAFDNVDMTYNSIVSPDGTTNGILLEQTGSNASNGLYNHNLTTDDGTYTYSIFIKAKDSTKIRIRHYDGSANAQDFDPQTMSAGVVAGGLNLNFEDFGSGWFRVSFTRTLSSASTHRLGIYPDRNNTQKGVYIFGLQIEAQSYATSYIPTAGTTVTRDAETCTDAGTSADFNSTEGVLYAEIAALDADSIYRYISLSDGTADNSVRVYLNSNGTQLSAQLRVGDVAQCVFDYTVSNVLEFNKIAFKYKENDFALWIDGVERDTDTSGSTFSADTLNELSFDREAGSSPFYGKTKAIKVYKEALSDPELATLTT